MNNKKFKEFRSKQELRNSFEKVSKVNPNELYIRLDTVKGMIGLSESTYNRIIKENTNRNNIIKSNKGNIYINLHIFEIIMNQNSRYFKGDEITSVREIFAENYMDKYNAKKKITPKAKLDLYYRNGGKYIEVKKLAIYINYQSDVLENIVKEMVRFDNKDILKQQDNKYIPEYFLLNCNGFNRLKEKINIDEKEMTLIDNLLQE